jgi:hypothetical protein
MNFRKIPNGCDKQGGKRADGLKEAKGTNWSTLGKVGMMGKWMEVES